MEACQSTRRNFFKLYSNDIVNQNDELENNSGTDEEEFEYNGLIYFSYCDNINLYNHSILMN